MIAVTLVLKRPASKMSERLSEAWLLAAWRWHYQAQVDLC